jgi:hypothetical protein
MTEPVKSRIIPMIAGLLLVAGCREEPPTRMPTVVETALPATAGEPLPEGGEDLLEIGPEAHRRNGGAEGVYAEFSTMEGRESGVPEAIRARVKAPLPEHAWYAQIATPVVSDLKAGDVLMLSFHVRAEVSAAEGGQGEFLIYLGTPGGEDTLPGLEVEPAVYRKLRVGKEWKQVLLPVQIGRDYVKLRTSLNFDLGFVVQTLEFAGIRLQRHPGTRLEDLPSAGWSE